VSNHLEDTTSPVSTEPVSMKPLFSRLLLCCLLPVFLFVGCDGSSSIGTTPPATLTYVNSTTFSAGGGRSQGIVVADFNGDGMPDIAVSNLNNNTVAVFLNQGNGIFGSPVLTTVQIPNALGPLAVGDFNGDGKPDLVVSTVLGTPVDIVLLGNGDGTFNQLAPIPNSLGFNQATVVDLNGDSHQDLLLVGDSFVGVSLGNGDGTFAAITYLTIPPGAFSYGGLAVADFNGDGNLDIAAVDTTTPAGGIGTGNLLFFAGNGDGTFQTATISPLSLDLPACLSAADFNGDGKPDLLISGSNLAEIALGNGDGTFQLSNPEIIYTTSYVGTNGVTGLGANLHADSKVDAVIGDYSGGILQIILNSALGLTSPTSGVFSFTFSPGLSHMAFGDFNNDGVLDVAVTNYQTGQISIILSSVPTTTP
jgi:FG-GAP-like repeat/FG-GAP repeat